MATTLDALTDVQSTRGDARVAQGNAEFVMEVQALHPQSFAWAMTCCDRRRADAEDLLQDVYVGVLDNGLRFNGRSTLKTWLFGVIRQKARARRRRERLREFLGARHIARIDTPAPVRPPDVDALEAERHNRTRAALGRLSARQREVLLLVFYHDMTVEEAAKVMRTSVGSARVHYDRGKKRLATLLGSDVP